MRCTKPLHGYHGATNPVTGKPYFFITKLVPGDKEPVEIRCGQCTSCRIHKAQEWAIRICHEAKTTNDLHQPSCFLTLTYNDPSLPVDESISKKELQKFLKRLRKKIHPQQIRYYGCGEYGEKFGRPHYHLILFGYNFPDKELISRTSAGDLYQSDILEDIWKKGFCTIGEVTLESAAYVARYCMKKVNGKKEKDHYEHMTRYGQIVQLHPEFALMSKGLGYDWYRENTSDCFPTEFLVVTDKKGKPRKAAVPRYYKKKYEEEFPDEYFDMVENRKDVPREDLDPFELMRKGLAVDVKTHQVIQRMYEKGYS